MAGKARKKKNISKFFFSHVRRISVQLVDQLFGNVIFYLFLGIVNRIVGLFTKRPIRGNFIFYASDKKYLQTMIYEWYVPFVRWRAGLGQIMRQNGYWILSFGIATNEEDFYNPENKQKLEKMLRRAERVAWIIGVEQLTFAGVLPGIFAKYGFERKIKAVEKMNTVTAVTQSVYITIEKENLPEDVPVVVLGGSGYIGKCVVTTLKKQRYPGKVYSIDIRNGDKSGVLPREIVSKPAIILNITKKFVIQDYLSQLWAGAVVINEVFPEPSEATIIAMDELEVVCYHITGVEAKAYPEMGKAYKGGIPCCASFKPKNGEGKYKVLTKRLTG
jgi:hypothetical protein